METLVWLFSSDDNDRPHHINDTGQNCLNDHALLRPLVAWARQGKIQFTIAFVSISWLSLKVLTGQMHLFGHAPPSFSRQSPPRIVLDATMVILCHFFVASETQWQWHNFLAVGYVFFLHILGQFAHGNSQNIVFGHCITIASCVFVLEAGSEVLPMLAIGATYRPEKSAIVALLSLFCYICEGLLSSRAWTAPSQYALLYLGTIEAKPTKEETTCWLDYYCTFSRVNDLIRKALGKGIVMEDIDGIPWCRTPSILRHEFAALRQRHASTGKALFVLFWPQIILCSIIGIFTAAAQLFSPLGVYYLLENLRNPDEAVFRPHLWLGVMVFGRVTQTILQQTYSSTSGKFGSYAKAMLTSEIYQGALASRELHGNFLGGTAAPDSADEDAEQEGTVTGMIENLVSTDIGTILGLRDVLFSVTSVPASIIATIALYTIVGWPSLLGVGLLLLGSPITTWIMDNVGSYEEEMRAAQDVRISLASEYLSSIRVIKYFGWEDTVIKKIGAARAKEQHHQWKIEVLNTAMLEMVYIVPIACLLLIFGLHVGVGGNELTASTAFTTITLLGMIRDDLTILALVVGDLPRAKVSLRRLDNYFKALTPLDVYENGPARIEKATFRRTATANFYLRDISIDFVQYGLNAVTGASGSGKSSLLLSLLGETVLEDGTVTREHDAVFAPQTPWLQAQSVRDNILFNYPYNDERYRRVVAACCLDVDFDAMEKGDDTNVGENGSALSGGQRARVALARALYSEGSLLLLDDIFSAFDTKTSVMLWNRVFCSDLLHKRTVILVTQLSWVVAEADLSITMENGRVQDLERNTGSSRKSKTVESDANKDVTEARAAYSEKMEPADIGDKDNTQGDTERLTDVDKEAASNQGSSSLSFVRYMMYYGGPIIALLTASTLAARTCTEMLTNYWISHWVNSVEDDNTKDTLYYLWAYVALCLANEVVDVVSTWAFMRGTWFAAKKLHDDFISSIMKVSLTWFTETPTGKVMNRLSGDISSLDQEVKQPLCSALRIIIRSVLMVGTVTSLLPSFLLPTVVLAALGAYVANVYNSTAQLIKQLVSASQSPILSEFSEGLSGMAVIRATRSTTPEMFYNKMNRLLYTSVRARSAQVELDQWLKFRTNMLAAAINVVAAVLAYRQQGRISAGVVGFCMSQANQISDTILWLVFSLSGLSVEMQAFHRIEEYCQLPPEEGTSGAGTHEDSIPNAWPTTGTIEFRNATVRYGESGPDILKGINLKFNAGERVAIVGRTGSGKSTLVLSILGFTKIVSGQILHDNIDITTIPRKRLRQAISTIPQEAQLFQGTISSNLDPTGAIAESELQKALDICQKFITRKNAKASDANEQDQQPAGDDTDETVSRGFAERLTLSTPVEPKGENFSHGQRQVLSLCRVLVRRSKLTLLDEATSNMDVETDAGVQAVLRQELGASNSHALITVAHRLQTIADYDRVVVMGSGEVLEEGAPEVLMKKKGHYYDMVMHSGEIDSKE